MGINNKIGNCLCIYFDYIDLNNVFTELLEGTYWLLMTHKIKIDIELNLMAYGKKKVKMSQNFNNSNLTSLLFN